MVMTVHEGMWFPSESLHIAHSPAKAKGSPDSMMMRMGFPDTPACCHS